MPRIRLTIDIETEVGQIPRIKVTGGEEMPGPELLFHLRNLCDVIQQQVLLATVLDRLRPAATAGRIVVPGMVPPADLRRG